MRWPFVTMKKYEGMVQQLYSLSLDQQKAHSSVVALKDREIAARDKEHARVLKEKDDLNEANEILTRANTVISKVVGVLTQRGVVRVAVDDLRRPMPTIYLDHDPHARKPMILVRAVYGPAIPPTSSSVVAVDKEGRAGPVLMEPDESEVRKTDADFDLETPPPA